jgi:hypothetical protein
VNRRRHHHPLFFSSLSLSLSQAQQNFNFLLGFLRRASLLKKPCVIYISAAEEKAAAVAERRRPTPRRLNRPGAVRQSLAMTLLCVMFSGKPNALFISTKGC